MSPVYRVVHHWLHNPEYSVGPATPKILPLKGSLSFENLVRQYAGDLPVGAVRSELESKGALVIDDDDLCTLKVHFLKFTEEHEDLYDWIFYSVRNLLETSEFNSRNSVAGSGTPEFDAAKNRFERAAWTNKISSKGALEFNKWLENHGQQFLEEASSFLSELEVDEDATEQQALGVGVYFYYQDRDGK